jgi:hypothetical protein
MKFHNTGYTYLNYGCVELWERENRHNVYLYRDVLMHNMLGTFMRCRVLYYPDMGDPYEWDYVYYEDAKKKALEIVYRVSRESDGIL